MCSACNRALKSFECVLFFFQVQFSWQRRERVDSMKLLKPVHLRAFLLSSFFFASMFLLTLFISMFKCENVGRLFFERIKDNVSLKTDIKRIVLYAATNKNPFYDLSHCK